MKKLPFVVLISIAPSLAFAEMSYDYFEVLAGFGTVEIAPNEYDSTDVSGGVSVAIHKNAALVGGANFGDIDLPAPLSASGSSMHIGVVAHAPAADNVDLLLGMAFGRIEIEASNGTTTFTDDDTSNAILLGIRAALSEKVEAEFNVVSEDSFGTRDESFGITGRINFSQSVAGAVGYDWTDDTTGVNIGVRIMF